MIKSMRSLALCAILLSCNNTRIEKRNNPVHIKEAEQRTVEFYQALGSGNIDQTALMFKSSLPDAKKMLNTLIEVNGKFIKAKLDKVETIYVEMGKSITKDYRVEAFATYEKHICKELINLSLENDTLKLSGFSSNIIEKNITSDTTKSDTVSEQ